MKTFLTWLSALGSLASIAGLWVALRVLREEKKIEHDLEKKQ